MRDPGLSTMDYIYRNKHVTEHGLGNHTLLFVVVFYLLTYLENIVSVWFMVFNATFNNISVISWRSVLLVDNPW
jgi:hypothetical protein